MATSPENNKESIYASPRMRAREQQLITETAAGNEKAFEQLYQLYFSRLFQFIFRITRTQNGIEEIINDVMYVVWEKASTYDQTCRPSTWILGIAYFKALKRVEKSVADEDRSVEFNDELDYFPDKSTQWISQIETSNWLEVAFTQLSTEQRAVVEMTYFQGLHYNEIAEIMQCPENTVKTRMFHARKILAKSLQED
ncbi:MAG: sigma-70 family RNA polymerase sigma factor [Burkholderiales bacterium]|uniref:RNA polymerase sigma factor n=1 Tax=Nitrosomonas sp. TaxID=42353 RepID=UPI001D4DA004|nr:sigma-70 family RNA polymerase sigma factor [Nitrosomonas sp.]MCB1949847.1 sigma-70 family RNA polymerase sigma factor [Nitrosomonas sp.]MCP5244405.1 sigma-70 family RNA polymerase sigma factor [Burkholderiales bacterium]